MPTPPQLTLIHTLVPIPPLFIYHRGRRELLGLRSERSSALCLTRRADVPARSPLRSHSGDQDLRQWHAAMPGEWTRTLRLFHTGRNPRSSCLSARVPGRSEEHTSELQSLMRISYAVFCLKKNKKKNKSMRNNMSKKK